MAKTDYTTWVDYYIRVLADKEELQHDAHDELVEEHLNDEREFNRDAAFFYRIRRRR